MPYRKKGHPISEKTDPYKVEASSADDLDGCAATELTGMMPTPPKSQAELESYESLMPFSPKSIVEKDEKIQQNIEKRKARR